MFKPITLAIVFVALTLSSARGAEPAAEEVLAGLKAFYAKTARADGSFQPGIDPEYVGMSDCAYSDLAAVTYAVTIHKTFGWKLPHEEKTIAFLHARQNERGDFVNVAGTVDPASPQGRVYNTTQALVALHALGEKPRRDPLPVFEEILKQDYKTLPAYSTSFFPLAYLCAGKPIPPTADKAIRALMIQDEDGYLNDHVAATFHASHYYALVGDPTPKAEQMVARTLRDQHANGSWLLNQPARDRHATFDAVFTLKHEGQDRDDVKTAIKKAAQWALSCRNDDGGFGHYPGSTSDADAIYFQVGTLVMAGYLKAVDPPPEKPELLSWGHLMPVVRRPAGKQDVLPHPGWVGGVAINSRELLATACSDGKVRLWDVWDESGATLLAPAHKDVCSSVAFLDDHTLASASYDGTVMLWDVKERRQTHRLVKHRGAVLCVAARNGRIAAGGIDGTIHVWDIEGKPLHALEGHKSWVNSVAIAADVLVSGSSDGTVKRWDLKSGEELETIKVSDAEVRSVAITPDGAMVAAGVRYGTVKLWRTRTADARRTLELKSDDISSLAFSSDGKRLLIAAGEWNRPGRVETWDVADGRKLSELAHTGEVLSVAISPLQNTTAAGGGDRAVMRWVKHAPTR